MGESRPSDAASRKVGSCCVTAWPVHSPTFPPEGRPPDSGERGKLPRSWGTLLQ